MSAILEALIAHKCAQERTSQSAHPNLGLSRIGSVHEGHSKRIQQLASLLTRMEDVQLGELRMSSPAISYASAQRSHRKKVTSQ